MPNPASGAGRNGTEQLATAWIPVPTFDSGIRSSSIVKLEKKENLSLGSESPHAMMTTVMEIVLVLSDKEEIIQRERAQVKSTSGGSAKLPPNNFNSWDNPDQRENSDSPDHPNLREQSKLWENPDSQDNSNSWDNPDPRDNSDLPVHPNLREQSIFGDNPDPRDNINSQDNLQHIDDVDNSDDPWENANSMDIDSVGNKDDPWDNDELQEDGECMKNEQSPSSNRKKILNGDECFNQNWKHASYPTVLRKSQML